MSDTFSFKFGALDDLNKKLNKAITGYNKDIFKKTKSATDIIWRTAHAKRPMISKAQQGRSVWGRKQQKFIKEGAIKRVSDPTAKAGVPVDTGALQESITKKVIGSMLKGYTGIVETSGIAYSSMIEFGTSKMRARPFMRPAISLNKATIKKVFGQQVNLDLK